ncbi:MAG: DUF971 domain-containing protein [Phototrophicales bacterium]
MTEKPRPTGITLNKNEGYMEINWNIDHVTARYSLPHLREACPCAECRGGHEFMGAAYDPDDLMSLQLLPARDYTIKDLQLIGNYAIQPVWGDGHSSGIFTWEYLWKIRPKEG